MNKNRKPVAGKTRKKMEKEVKKGQKGLFTEEGEPTEKLKANKALIKRTHKKMEIKKKKAKSNRSKRTTPGDVDHRESPPAHIHRESDVWEKTLDKQNKVKRVALTKKLEKRDSKRKR